MNSNVRNTLKTIEDGLFKARRLATLRNDGEMYSKIDDEYLRVQALGMLLALNERAHQKEPPLTLGRPQG